MQSYKTIADSKKQAGRWSKEEHQRFMLGLMQYGKNWRKIQEIVATRSGSQIRSHAQKFFSKIQKCSQQPKSQRDQQANIFGQQINQDEASFTQYNDIIKSIDDDGSQATPLEIISLIKKQSVDNRKVNLSNFKKSLQQNQQKQKIYFQDGRNQQSFLTLKNTNLYKNHQNGEQIGQLNSYKSMNNILSAYEALNETDPQNRYEDESFLIGLTKKYKKYFSKGGQFQNLIDFGNPQEVEKAAQIGKSLRKKSWTLPEGIQGDQNDLQEIKKKLKQSKLLKGQQNKINLDQAEVKPQNSLKTQNKLTSTIDIDIHKKQQLQNNQK